MSIATSAGIALSVLALTIAAAEGAQPCACPVGARAVRGRVRVPGRGHASRSASRATHCSRRHRDGGCAYAPLSETLFMLGPNFTAEFVIDQAGGATQILSNGKGIEFRLRRKGSPPEAAPRRPGRAAAVRVPRSVLERYVGVYEFVPGQMSRTDLRIVVRLEGDTLIREGAGPTSILTPISETRFKVGSTSAMVEFVVDEAGVMQVMGSGFQQALARLTSKR